MQMAIQYGPDAPARVLDGWQRESGRLATNVPYWDAVAALNTPAKLDGWPGFDDQGNPMDGPACTERHDAFLRGTRPARPCLAAGVRGRANFLERRQYEVRRIPIPRTQVNKPKTRPSRGCTLIAALL
jgi:hypothetical protein